MNAIVAYHVYDLADTKEEMTIFLDMRNKHGSKSGLIMIESSFDNLNQDHKDSLASSKPGYIGGKVKPDVTMHMTERVFDDLSDGKLSGFFGWLSGKVRITGNLPLCGKFDELVVRRYNPDEGYSKTEKPPQ